MTIVLIPGAGVLEWLGLLMVKMTATFIHLYQELNSTRVKDTRNGKRTRTIVSQTPVMLFQRTTNSIPIAKEWMVLSAVQLRQSYVGTMSRMGHKFPYPRRGLQRTMISQEEAFIKLRRRIENKIQNKLLSICDLIALSTMAALVTIAKITIKIVSNLSSFRDALEHTNNFIMMTVVGYKVVALSNATDDDELTVNFAASNEPTEFGLDNCATHHICTNKRLFTNIIIPKKEIGVNGVTGSLTAEGIGTVQFRMQDDNEKQHLITLDNVILLPAAPKNLISISRWSKDVGDDCAVTSRGSYSVFQWGNDRYKKTVHHPPDCEIPLMHVNESEGDEALLMFVQDNKRKFIDEKDVNDRSTKHHNNEGALQCNVVDDKQSLTDCNAITPSEARVGDTVRVLKNNELTQVTILRIFKTGNKSLRYKVKPIKGDAPFVVQPDNILSLTPDPADIPHSSTEIEPTSIANILTKDDLERLWNPTSDDTVSEESRTTLYWHHRLRCAPLKHLHRLATRGVIPKCIKKVKRMPLCASCAFAAAHRRRWRTKGEKNRRHIRKSWQKEPGSGTSCDHIVSHQPGLIPQLTGKPTHERFWGSVLYVDHATDYIFNHLIRGTSSQETFESKMAYERHAHTHGVTIEAYHADNSRFNDAKFAGSCRDAGQQLTFCGVGAHHQNALAESKIKEICYGGRTVLLHAKRKWPSVISTILWPFAVQSIVDRHNRLSLDENGKSPLEQFAKTSDDIRAEDFHTWGCPVFVLEAPNQSGSIGTSKWEPRTRVGIYLGRSPSHAGNVALVLNLQSGLVSPQYHIVVDDEFTTVKYLDSATPPPNWNELVRKHKESSTDFGNDQLNLEWLYPSSFPTHASTSPSTPPPKGLTDKDDNSKQDARISSPITNRSEGVGSTSYADTNIFPEPRASPTQQPVVQAPQGEGGGGDTYHHLFELGNIGTKAKSPHSSAKAETNLYFYLHGLPQPHRHHKRNSNGRDSVLSNAQG